MEMKTWLIQRQLHELKVLKQQLVSTAKTGISLHKQQINTVNEKYAMEIYQLFNCYYDAMMTFQIFRYNVTFIFF